MKKNHGRGMGRFSRSLRANYDVIEKATEDVQTMREEAATALQEAVDRGELTEVADHLLAYARGPAGGVGVVLLTLELAYRIDLHKTAALIRLVDRRR